MTTFNLNNTNAITTLVDGKYSKLIRIEEDQDSYDLYVGDEFICAIRGKTITVNYYTDYCISIHTDNGAEVSIELDKDSVTTTITL